MLVSYLTTATLIRTGTTISSLAQYTILNSLQYYSLVKHIYAIEAISNSQSIKTHDDWQVATS